MREEKRKDGQNRRRENCGKGKLEVQRCRAVKRGAIGRCR